VWNDILVDGHHRYEICTKHQIPYAVKSIVFDSLDDAKYWILKHLVNRRNLTPFHRAEIVLKHKDVILKKAKERRRIVEERKGTSSRREYKRLQSDTTDLPTANECTAPSETTNAAEKEAEMLLIRRETTPEEWAAFLVTHYSIEFMRSLIFCLVDEYHRRYGKEATQHFLLKICAKFIE